MTAVDIVEEKIKKLNNWQATIQDEYIEKFFKEHEKRRLSLHFAWNNGTACDNLSDEVYKNADFVIIAAPTNYDSQKNFFDTSGVESVIKQVLSVSDKAYIVIKSTVPVGYTKSIREKYHTNRILFSSEFLRESKPFMIIFTHHALSWVRTQLISKL